MGRPRKNEIDALTETLHLRVTREEADRIYAGSLRTGLSTSKYLRLALRAVLDGGSFRVNVEVSTEGPD